MLFAKSTGNTCARALNFIKKETLAHMFSCEFCGISGNTFSYRTHCLKKSGRTRGTRNEEFEVLKELFLLPVTDNTFIQIFFNEWVCSCQRGNLRIRWILSNLLNFSMNKTKPLLQLHIDIWKTRIYGAIKMLVKVWKIETNG